MKRLTPLALAFPLLLIGCGDSQAEAERVALAEEAIAEVCADKVFDYAKYPAAAEFVDPVPAGIRESEPGQGPASTEYISVNLGDVHFVNAFGVPSEYGYGCVVYLDETHEVIGSQALAKEDTYGINSVFYVSSSDELR